jgi:hypothetical protein
VRRVLYDSQGSITSEVFADEGKTVIRSTEDVTELLKQAKLEREAFEAGPRAGARDFVPAAKIPQSVVDQAIREGWFNDRKRWKAWLNDAQNRDFRIYGGRV